MRTRANESVSEAKTLPCLSCANGSVIEAKALPCSSRADLSGSEDKGFAVP